MVLKRTPFVAVPRAEITLLDGSALFSFSASSPSFPSEAFRSIIVTQNGLISVDHSFSVFPAKKSS